MSSIATFHEPAAATRFRVPLTHLAFPLRCVCCGSESNTTAHVSGTSRRERSVLWVMVALGVVTMAAYSLTYPHPEFAVMGVLSIIGQLAAIYLLFYWILLSPVLMLYRYLRRTLGLVGFILGGISAAFLWLCMAFYGASLADGSDVVETIGLLAGLYLVVLFVIHVNCQLHLYPPVCDRCGKLGAAAVRVADYFPLRRKAVLEFRNEEYAEAFGRINAVTSD